MNTHFYDALIPFLTDEEQQGLTAPAKQHAELNAQLAEQLKEIDALKEEYNKGIDAERSDDDMENLSDDERAAELKKIDEAQAKLATLRELIASSLDTIKSINELKSRYGAQNSELINNLLTRYLKARKGDTQAILNDIEHALNEITLEDYKDYVRRSKEKHKTLKEEYKALVDAGETLTPDQQRRLDAASRRATARWNNCVLYLKACMWDFYETLIYSSTGRMMYSANGVDYLGNDEITENSEVGNLDIDGIEEADELIRARADAFGYKRPAGKAARNKSVSRIEHTLLDDIYYTPNSDAAYRLIDAVANGSKNKEVYLNMLKHTNPNYDYSAVEVTHDLVTGVAGVVGVEKVPFNQYTIQKDNQKIVIELVVLGALSKVSPYAAKMLVFILAKINRQASNIKGELTRNYITFTLQELVDLKMYSDVRSARAAFWNIMPVLRHVSIYGFLMPDKDSKDTTPDGEKKDNTPLSGKGGGIIGTFGIEPDGRTCKVYLEEGADWKLLLQFYAALPTFYFELSSLAASIVLYATHLARIRAKEIKKDDTQQVIPLSLEALRERLMLPDMEGNKKRYETIRKPIEDAIDEIEQAQERAIKEHPDQTDLADMTFSFKRSDTSKRDTTQDFLNSTLEVTIKGRLFKYNKEQSTKRITHKNTNKRLKEQARLKALTDAETKRLEAQQATATDHPNTKTDNAAGTLEGSKPHEEHEQTGSSGKSDSDSLPRN